MEKSKKIMKKIYRLNNVLNNEKIEEIWFKSKGLSSIIHTNKITFDYDLDKEFKSLNYNIFNWINGEVNNLLNLKIRYKTDKLDFIKEDKTFIVRLYNEKNQVKFALRIHIK